MRALTLLICGFIVTACVDDKSDVRGELGEVVFEYECIDSTDYQCLDGDRGLPAAIGVGGSFALDEDEWFSSRQDIVPGSREMVERSGQGFTWKKAGYAAILIFDFEGDIEDFVHLKGADVEVLNVLDEDDVSTVAVDLMVGKSLILRVRPETMKGTVLGGAFSYEWRSEDESVVQVSPGVSNQVRLSGTGVGNASVKVTLQQLSASVQVEVVANPNLPDDAGLDDSTVVDENDASLVDSAVIDKSDAGLVDSAVIDENDAVVVDDAGSEEDAQ